MHPSAQEQMADDSGLRELDGLLVPADTSQQEEQLLRAVLSGEEYRLPELPERLQAALIVDVGANLGMFVAAARRRFPEAPIVAVEPSPRSLPALQRNAARLGAVVVRPVALGAQDGRLPLHLGAVASGLTDSLHPNRLSGAETVEVEVRDAARFFDELGVPELAILKLDTEGCELAILARLQTELSRFASVLLEYHSERDRRAIDGLLAASHALYFARADVPHRGTCGYLRRDILAESGQGFREIQRSS